MSESVVAAPTLAALPAGPDSGGTLAPDTVIGGNYSIVRVIGQGGMATVYEALDIKAGRQVAIKVLSREFADNAALVARFKNEVSTTAKIGHPNIISIFAFGFLEAASAQPYFAMEYLASGESLETRLRRGPLSAAEARKPLAETLRALEAAHKAGVIHRDLKPDNLWLGSAHGEVFMKVLDFGIAKLTSSTGHVVKTREGVAMGTPLFMSPEQWSGKEVDHRTDIYAMGAVLFATLTGGKLPFTADSQEGLMAKVLTEAPARPSSFVPMDPKLERLILRCLERDSVKRPQSAKDLRLELDAILERLERRRSKWHVVGLIGATTALAVAALGARFGGDHAAKTVGSETPAPNVAPLALVPTQPPEAAIPSLAKGADEAPAPADKRVAPARRPQGGRIKPQASAATAPTAAVTGVVSAPSPTPFSPYRER